MNIVNAKDFEDMIVMYMKRKSLIPIIGSGCTSGCRTAKGMVPSGGNYKTHMINTLRAMPIFSEEEKDIIEKSLFSQVCSYYEDDENVSEEVRVQYLKNNFYNVRYDSRDKRKCLFEIEWPYIYTLNIDDGIEKNSKYTEKILPNRECRDEIFDDKNCVIKLHGDIGEIVKYKDSSKIFTRREYASSIESNTFLLNKLRDDYANQNIIFIGCSLEDEMDLMIIDKTLPVKDKNYNSSSKIILLFKGRPGNLQISNFKSYGITDIVCFDDYPEIYEFLSNAWEKACSVQNNELDFYENLKIVELKSDDKDNREYFFEGRTLLNTRESSVVYPYYFIKRIVTNEILGFINKNRIHLVYGRRISGKSYLLADLYHSLKDRRVYYLDGTSRISNEALVKLLRMNDIVVLLDVGTIDREQFESILLHAEEINKNGNNFIITYNDSEMLGVVKWKIKEGKIKEEDILRYEIKGRWNTKGSYQEVQEINKRLPFVGLPIYKGKTSFLDHILKSEEALGVGGRFVQKEIKIKTVKELTLLIMFAVKEKLYSIDIVTFSLNKELFRALAEYDPFIEEVDTPYFERSNSRMSSVKYVLNSKFWLRRELGYFADDKSHYDIICNSFYLIVSSIMTQYGDSRMRWKKYRDYIMFDVLNDIFLNEKGGRLSLLVHIYSKLHSLLADDFNFLHQNAKCYINYSRIDKAERIKYLTKSAELSLVSISIIEGRLEDTESDNLNIALAHVQHTRANALCKLCEAVGYKNNKYLETAIEAIYIAVNNKYNYIDDIKKNNDYKYIKIFLNKYHIGSNKLDSEHINKIRELNDVFR